MHFTLNELVKLCKAMEPRKAHLYHNGDSRSQCVTPLITSIEMHDGKTYKLLDKNGYIGAGYIRVSTNKQRSYDLEKALENDDGRDDRSPLRDGWSETFQVIRTVEHFVRISLCFRIYSDCGISGSVPFRNDDMIRRLNKQRAETYEACFSRVFLSESATNRQTKSETENMRKYMEARVAAMRAGAMDETEIADPTKIIHKRPKNVVQYRPGLTELVGDLKIICVITAVDLSRISRSYLLLQEIANQILDYKLPWDWLNPDNPKSKGPIRVVGLLSELSFLSSNKFEGRIMRDIVAHMAEFRLQEVITGAFQGAIQRLESGQPHGMVPFYYSTDKYGRVHKNDAISTLNMMIEMALSQSDVIPSTKWEDHQGSGTIARQLTDLGVPTPMAARKNLTPTKWGRNSVSKILKSLWLIGKQEMFGRVFQVVEDPAIDEHTYFRLQRWLQNRSANALGGVKSGQTAYLGTSLFVCHCGNTLSHRHRREIKKSKAPELTGDIVLNHEQYWCETSKRRTHDNHVLLNVRNAHQFLNVYMAGSAPMIMDQLRDSVERRELEAEKRALEERLFEIERTRPTDEIIREEVLSQVPEDDRDDEGIVSAYIARKLKKWLHEEEEIEAKIEIINERLRAVLSRDDLSSMSEKLTTWTSLSDDQKNAIIRQLFLRFEFHGNPPNEMVVPILRTIDETPLPPIGFARTIYKNGWIRRLPVTPEELLGSYRAFDG